jgi:tyrosyl-tRNA synthetase
MPLYFEVLTDVPMNDVNEIRQIITGGRENPMEIKKRLASEIVAQFHSPAAAIQGRDAFERQFQRREAPSEMPEYAISEPQGVIDLLVATGLASSKSDARRLIDGGGVKLDNERISSFNQLIAAPAVIQKGRHFVRIVVKN